MRWTNEICQWDPQQWHGIDVMYMKPSDVWIPDLTLYNNVEIQKDFILKGTEHVHFFANGSNMWYPQVRIVYIQVFLCTGMEGVKLSDSL